METSELTGVALDWAVAKCENLTPKIPAHTENWTNKWLLYSDCNGQDHLLPSYVNTWALAGPIIEREAIWVKKITTGLWVARLNNEDYWHSGVQGQTLIEAAMRCYVASKLGEEVDIPDELMG